MLRSSARVVLGFAVGVTGTSLGTWAVLHTEPSVDHQPLSRASDEIAFREDPAVFADRLRAAHNAEPIDVDWGTSTSADFARELGMIQIGEATVIGVDCRTSTCLATLEWPDYTQARQAMHPLATGTFSHRCTRTVSMVPPDDDAVGAYRGLMVFDCSEERLAGSPRSVASMDGLSGSGP
jgi:hypothetical protein